MTSYADNEIATTSGYIAKEAGVGFYGSSTLLGTVNTQYSDEYGKVAGGAQIGKTIRVKFPAEFITTSQVTIDANSIQAIRQDTKVLTLDERPEIHTELDTEQATFELENGGDRYAKEVLRPMGAQLGSKCESIGFVKIANEAQNTIVLETPFADADVLRQAFVTMRSQLDKQLAPVGNRTTVLGSDAEIVVANSVLPLFHSQLQIEKAYKEGKMDMYGGLKWMCSNLVHTRVNGAGGTAGVTVTAYVEGSATITISSSAGFVVGDKITLPGIKLVHRQSKIAYGDNIQRAVLAINANVITIDPIWGPTSGGRQNASAVPVATQAVTILGTAGETYMCCPVYQKDGVTMGSADLYLPKKVEMASRNKVNNVSMRYINDYETRSDLLPSRFEAILTWDLLRPEWNGSVELKIS